MLMGQDVRAANHELQALQQGCHRGIQASGDDLQRDDSGFSLAPLNVRDVPSVHIQIGRHIGLGPPFLLSQSLDALSQFD